jgi:intergrase/recombinase
MNPDDLPTSLLKSVSCLPNSVSFPSQRSTGLSYPTTKEERIVEGSQFLDDHWNRYEEFLKQNFSTHTAKVRLSHSKKYCRILDSGDARELLELSKDKRLHAMKALATLSKYVGCYDEWKDIRERHQLKWSDENGLKAFNDIMNCKENYNSMMNWIIDTISKLPVQYGNIILYNTLTGLRPDEACKSIILLKEKGQNGYFNRDVMTLEHFRYPGIFIRRTKNAYISVMTNSVLELAKQSANCGYNALRIATKRYGLSMNMGFCRKIVATHLRINNIEQETIDLLQGRVPGSVFARHYFRPDFNYERIRYLLNKLHGSFVAK